jgi:hypothetical protein
MNAHNETLAQHRKEILENKKKHWKWLPERARIIPETRCDTMYDTDYTTN